MATILGADNSTVLKINQFLGIHESKDGATTLKPGEMSEMRNFRVTEDGHLQIRPGTKTVMKLADFVPLGEEGGALRGVWRGLVGEEEHTLCSLGGYLFDVDVENKTAVLKGTATDDETFFFGFGGKVYLLNGHEYRSWDGGAETGFEPVIGYAPIVQTATTPAGDGTLLESVNRLTPARRVQFSPDGTSDTFVLPNQDITGVTKMFVNGEEVSIYFVVIADDIGDPSIPIGTVTDELKWMRFVGGDTGVTRMTKADGESPTELTFTFPDGRSEDIPTDEVAERTGFEPDPGHFDDYHYLDFTPTKKFTEDTAEGTITFSAGYIPAKGTNTLTIQYEKGIAAENDVKKMRYAEIFNGSTDARIFLYGDGTNRTVYSGVAYESGKASADYFPDLNEIDVGDQNTPLTGLVRHYARLMAFKPGSAWVIQYGRITLEDGIDTAAFYVQPVNRMTGCDAPGTVQILQNNPVTVESGQIYHWKSGSSSSAYISANENNANRISDRVASLLRENFPDGIRTANLREGREFWFLRQGKALILNYALNVWYYYDSLPFDRVLEIGSEVYGFGAGGDVVHFSRSYHSDNGAAISCYGATGFMDFSKDWIYKYSPMVFVAMKPESGARITVTANSSRRSLYPEKTVAANLATFEHMDFAHFSFSTNRNPQTRRVKLKVKKAAFYRLVFKSESASATATVIEADVKLRYAGQVK